MSSVNFSDLVKVADTSTVGEPVPAATYEVYVSSAKAEKAKTGKDMISVQFKISSGPHKGRVVFNNFVLSPDSANAMAFFFQHMKALGLSREYFTSNPSLEEVAKNLKNKRAIIVVTQREFNDEIKNDVKNVKPPEGGNAGPGAVAGGPAPLPKKGLDPDLTGEDLPEDDEEEDEEEEAPPPKPKAKKKRKKPEPEPEPEEDEDEGEEEEDDAEDEDDVPPPPPTPF